MKKAIELLGIILLTGVLIAACTTIIPMDKECNCLFQVVENEIETQHTVRDGYNKPRFGGMYDLAREARRKADEAIQARTRSECEKTGQ
jgi:hypothetical protein